MIARMIVLIAFTVGLVVMSPHVGYAQSMQMPSLKQSNGVEINFSDDIKDMIEKHMKNDTYNITDGFRDFGPLATAIAALAAACIYGRQLQKSTNKYIRQQYKFDRNIRSNNAKAIAAALGSEIVTLLTVYSNVCEKLHDAKKTSRDVSFDEIQHEFLDPIVYKSLIDQIGHLPNDLSYGISTDYDNYRIFQNEIEEQKRYSYSNSLRVPDTVLKNIYDKAQKDSEALYETTRRISQYLQDDRIATSAGYHYQHISNIIIAQPD